MKVEIRPLKIEDAYTSYHWRNDKEVFKLTGTIYSNEITLDMELAWIKKVIRNKDEYRCAIIADNNYVGNIYLTDITKETANIHIFIGDRNLYGKGVGRKASELILDYAKSTLRLKAINMDVREENIASITLYTKLGFKMTDNTGNGFLKMTKTLSQHESE